MKPFSRTIQWAVILVTFAWLALVPLTAQASVYGRGNYGTCPYQGNCPAAATPSATTPATPAQPPSPTVITMMSGLEIAVNLRDGQVIPRSGYDITVTPLNGEGRSFQEASITIDGRLVFTGPPGSDGTLLWHWDPLAHSGTTVVVSVTDGSGQTITKTFHVTIAAALVRTPAVQPAEDKGEGILNTILDGISRLFHSLPAPVVYSFPYILLVLLAIDILIVVMQLDREMKGYRRLSRLAALERQIAEDKKGLVQLVSHYLRTPMTVISGGIELSGEQAAPTQAGQIGVLQAICQRMLQTVEQLIAQLEATLALPAEVRMPIAARLSILRQPGLFLPIALVGGIGLVFNLLARYAAELPLETANLVAQTAIYFALAALLYQAVRRLHLRRAERQQMQQLLQQQAQAAAGRDQLIAGALDSLLGDFQQLAAAAAPVDDGDGGRYLTGGLDRLRAILAKFAFARHLKGDHSPAPLEPASLDDMVSLIAEPIRKKAAEKPVVIAEGVNRPLVVKDRELMGYVISSLVDNAVSYSHPDSSIQLSAETSSGVTRLTVADSGDGIDPEKQALLLRPFAKAEGVETFTHEGMGFDLYLDKLIMSYLGGSLELSSQPGTGTRVSMVLPTT